MFRILSEGRIRLPRRGIVSLTSLFLLIEFIDEMVYGIGGAVMPSLRDEFSLTYTQVGTFLAVPYIINTFLEPAIMLLGDTRYRKLLVVAGGFLFAAAAALFGAAWTFPVLLIASVLSFPASSAFVSLSQATLMDLNHGRQAQMVARWTLSGTLGNLVGPLLLAGGLALRFGWRWLYLGLAVICLGSVIIVLKKEFPLRVTKDGGLADEVKDVLQGAWKAVRNLRLLRWLVLLEFSDLLLDIFTGFLALYFTEAAGFTNAQAGVVVSAYIAASLVSDFVVVRLLERIPGRRLVRLTAATMLFIYPIWLLVPWTWAKLGLLMVIPFCRIGWYPVLEGESFATIPERSATVNLVGSLGGPLAAGLAYMVSAAAEAFTLPAAMWLLLLGPLVLVLFVPREEMRISISDMESLS